ncbi:integrase arm-type DNA-binding domain-containing protein [Planktomarina temperata]|nr:integrase arm-type DNA-binding domain-containing protein [Planktomarina temperata]
MAKALTAKGIEAIKPDQFKRREIPDPALSGLYLVVQPSGVKSWALRYRFLTKTKKMTLGRWPLMGLVDARAAASEALAKRELGVDPVTAKKQAEAMRYDTQITEHDSFRSLMEVYSKRHLAKLKSGRVVRRELERHAMKLWGDNDIRDISKRDVIDLLDTIAETGRIPTANRLRSYLAHFFRWCEDRDVISNSPMLGLKPVGREKSRERVLNDDELRWFWLACIELGFPWGFLGQILLLTGQRLGEVGGITCDEIQGEMWTMAGGRTKNGRSHDVPLSSVAMNLLTKIQDFENPSQLLFTTTGYTPLSGFHKGRNHIAQRMCEIASREMGVEVDVPHWTFHDLRRTAATGMARIGVPVRVTEAILNHVSGTASGIVSVYQKHDYALEKQDALYAWAEFVIQVTERRNEGSL